MRVLRLIILCVIAALPGQLFAQCPDSTEPNDTPAQAVAVSPPLNSDLCIDAEGDEDYFVFTADAAQGVIVNVITAPMRAEPVVSIALLESDGVTEVDVPGYYVPAPEVNQNWGRICVYTEAVHTYYVRVGGLGSYAGPYILQIAVEPLRFAAYPVLNGLRIVKNAGNMELLWRYQGACPGGNYSETHFNVFRADQTTNTFYDKIAETGDYHYDAGRVSDAPSLLYFGVQSENDFGDGDTTPNFIRIVTDPPGDFTISKAFPFSDDPCAVPNAHPQLPLTFRTWLLDRFGTPVDGIPIDFYLDPYFYNDFMHCFCPGGMGDSFVSGTSGQDGPGEVDLLISIGGLLDPTLCNDGPPDPPEFRCSTVLHITPGYVDAGHFRHYVKYKFVD